MGDVIDIFSRRSNVHSVQQDAPGADHIYVEAVGGKPVVWMQFSCEFEVDGERFGFTIWAENHNDAERRMNKLRSSARVLGQLYSVIPE